MRTTISGRGWQITVPAGWIAVDGETAAMVLRELDDADGADDTDDSGQGTELVLVREADGDDRITLIATDIDEEWLNAAAVEGMGKALVATIRQHHRTGVSPLQPFKVGGEPATAFNYFVKGESGRIANRQGFFVADGVAYDLVMANGSGEAGVEACLGAYDEIVRGWKWAPATEAATTE